MDNNNYNPNNQNNYQQPQYHQVPNQQDYQQPQYQQVPNQQNYQQPQYQQAPNQQYYQQPQYQQAPIYQNSFVPQRSIVTCIILSIVTCGIYGIYWMYTLAEDVKAMSGDPTAPSGGMVILLTLITCGIYGYIWMYKQGETLDRIKSSRGMYSTNSGIIYLILSIFGLGIVSYALMQDSINKLV